MEKVGDYEAIVLGSPNHMGRLSRAMQKFVNRLAIANLKAKHLAIFGTYSGRARSDRAVSKLEKIARAKLPNLNLVLPGLSVRVNGVTGPIFEGELPKCVEFGRAIAGKLVL